ncbi:hypothetical protein Tco_0720469 [Tanacetum coccineum]
MYLISIKSVEPGDIALRPQLKKIIGFSLRYLPAFKVLGGTFFIHSLVTLFSFAVTPSCLSSATDVSRLGYSVYSFAVTPSCLSSATGKFVPPECNMAAACQGQVLAERTSSRMKRKAKCIPGLSTWDALAPFRNVDLSSMRLLTDEVLSGMSAQTFSRSLDAITLKGLFGSNARLIVEDPAPGVPRVAMPRCLRLNIGDLYDRMGRLEIRQGS